MSQVPSGEWRGSLGDNLLILAIILLEMMTMTMTVTMTDLTKAGTSRLQELVEGKVSCCRVEVGQGESAG